MFVLCKCFLPYLQTGKVINGEISSLLDKYML